MNRGRAQMVEHEIDPPAGRGVLHRLDQIRLCRIDEHIGTELGGAGQLLIGS